MSDLGSPSSYLLLRPGVPVISRDGETVGTVARILAAPDVDIFDGIVIDTEHGQRVIGGADVTEIYDRGVELAIDAATVEVGPRPRPSS